MGVAPVRFPKKREWAALVLLFESLGYEANLGKAIDVLRKEMCLTNKTARNIIKRLSKLNFIKIEIVGGQVSLRIKNPAEALREIAISYATSRRKRCS
jgi:hypothetical protein